MADVVLLARQLPDVDGAVAENLYNLIYDVIIEVENGIEGDLEQTHLLLALDARHYDD